jgi:hypothetical protein
LDTVLPDDRGVAADVIGVTMRVDERREPVVAEPALAREERER